MTDGSLKQLIVVPDGALAMLPFDALVTTTGDDRNICSTPARPMVGAASSTLC